MPRSIFATFAISTLGLFAQTPRPAAPAGDVLGVGNFIHVVANLDKSIEFYHDVIGLDLTGAPGPHLFSASAIVSALYDAPVDSRVASLRIPGSEMAVEIVEFKDLAATPSHPRIQDPGAIILRLFVRDLDTLMARLKQAKTPLVTTGGEPVTLNRSPELNGSREVMVRDPDGIFIRLIQPDPAPAGAGNVFGAAFGITVGDMEKTTQLYRDALGFQPQMDGGFHADEKQMAITGTPTAQFRRSTAIVPGGSFEVEFVEFKGVDRAPVHLAIHDPGASVLRLRVKDLDKTLTALKAAGNPVVSVGGQPASFGRSRAVIVREPNNLFLQALQ